MTMHNDSDAIMSDLLARWHRSEDSRYGRGYDRRAHIMGKSLSDERDEDDADEELEAGRMRLLGEEVARMPDPYRHAIQCMARNAAVGAAVFASPRLPADPVERQEVVRAAVRILTGRLLAIGVI